MLATKNPKIKKADDVMKQLAADKHTRMLYRKREMARMDFTLMKIKTLRAERDRLLNLIAEKEAEIAKNEAKIAENDAEIEQTREQIAVLKEQSTEKIINDDD